MLLACGSDMPGVIAARPAVDTVFVTELGSEVDEAISSSLDVAASSLCTARISLLFLKDRRANVCQI